MKLNLGCGQNKLAGYINCDVQAAAKPDIQFDLTQSVWPFEDSTVDEVVLNHVLEHVGVHPRDFIHVFEELYRVCKGGAVIAIAVPHPRHDHFLGDPTHVRAVTPEVISLFSRENCERWAREGAANSPLALYHNVDFRLHDARYIVDPKFRDKPNLEDLMRHWNNVVVEIRMLLEVVKPGVQVDAPIEARGAA